MFLFHFHLHFVLFIIGSSISIDVSENDGLQTGSTTIMSGADVEKILRIIKETDEEFKEKEKQILDEFERRRKEENIKEMEKELKKQKREQEKLRKENEKAQKKRDKMEKEEQRKKHCNGGGHRRCLQPGKGTTKGTICKLLTNKC